MASEDIAWTAEVREHVFHFLSVNKLGGVLVWGQVGVKSKKANVIVL